MLVHKAMWAVLFAAAVAVPEQARAQASSPCAPDSTFGGYFREQAAQMASDSVYAQFRTEHGLPTISRTNVSVVQDAAVCDSARNAWASAVSRFGWPAPARVYVVHMGSHRLVLDPDQPLEGEFFHLIIFDGQFHVVVEFAG